jgi:hypothetical protein
MHLFGYNNNEFRFQVINCWIIQEKVFKVNQGSSYIWNYFIIEVIGIFIIMKVWMEIYIS